MRNGPSIQNVTIDPTGAYHVTPGYWLNSEATSNTGECHAISLRLEDGSGNPISTAQTVTAAAGFQVGVSAGVLGTTALVTPTPFGVATVYVGVGVTSGLLAASKTSNGTIAAETTMFTVAGMDVKNPSEITTLWDVPKSVATFTTTAALNQVVIQIPAGLTGAPTTGTTYTYTVYPYQPADSVYVTVPVAVSAGTNAGAITITIPTNTPSATTVSGTHASVGAGGATGSGAFDLSKGELLQFRNGGLGGTLEGYFRVNN